MSKEQERNTVNPDFPNLSAVRTLISIQTDERGVHLLFYDGHDYPEGSIREARYVITYSPHHAFEIASMILQAAHRMMDRQYPWDFFVGAPKPFPVDARPGSMYGLSRLPEDDQAQEGPHIGGLLGSQLDDILSGQEPPPPPEPPTAPSDDGY